MEAQDLYIKSSEKAKHILSTPIKDLIREFLEDEFLAHNEYIVFHDKILESVNGCPTELMKELLSNLSEMADDEAKHYRYLLRLERCL